MPSWCLLQVSSKLLCLKKAFIHHLQGSAPTALCVLVVVGCVSAHNRPDQSHKRGDFYTTTYLSHAEALRTVFPDAKKVLFEEAYLSVAERSRIEKHLPERLRQGVFKVYFGLRESGEFDGYAVIHEEIGKFKLFTFVVGVEPDGTVRRVAVMVYRESRGGEVARRRFLTQYDGKSVKAPLSINRDIINVTGATMSVNSMNHGVKKVLAAVEVLYRGQPDRLRRVLEEGQELKEFAALDFPSGASDELQRVFEARMLMGTLCEIEAWSSDPSNGRRALDEAFSEIESVDRALSDYRPDSELSLISRRAGSEAVQVSPRTLGFLDRALALAKATNGASDISIGPAVDLWGFRGPTRKLPSEIELQALRPRVDYRKILMSGNQVRLETPGMRLDPGAIGKGYAVDRAVERLRQFGVEKALVNFSGTIYALGFPPGRAGWPVAIRNPTRPDTVLGTLCLRDEAVSSSGGYEKFVEIDGERFSHIISPRTLRPVEGVLGTTVRAPSATLADAWSTALMVLGTDGIRLLDQDRQEPNQVEAMVVTVDGARHRSENCRPDLVASLAQKSEVHPRTRAFAVVSAAELKE